MVRRCGRRAYGRPWTASTSARCASPPLRYRERMNIEQNAIDVGTVRLRRA